jgi:uncharacterized protein (TIGR03545 family)
MKIVRWRAAVPFGLVLALVAVALWLYLDRLVERGVEAAGTAIVGARVELASADFRPREGAVALRGLQVTNPNAPMTNLIEATDIIGDLAVVPLLERRVVVETLVVRGVRFNTPRQASGAIENPNPETARILREVNAWANAVRVPPLGVEGLRQVVDLNRISSDSLRTLAAARAIAAQASGLPEEWAARVAGLDPRPRLDSARALVARLRSANPLRLGLQGVRELSASAQQTLTGLTALRGSLTSLDSAARSQISDVERQVRGLADARTADLEYARGLFHLPSLEAPDISAAVFGDAAVQWMAPVLQWVRVAERYVPPGLDPRRRPGPKRARFAGTDVEFPGGATYPRFLLQHGELDMRLGSAGAAAGAYLARITGLTSDPSLYGRPTRILAHRKEGVRGPAEVRVAAVLDHVSEDIRDSVDAFVSGIALPSFELPALAARLALGSGTTALRLTRRGDALEATWQWRAPGVTWERLGAAPTTEAAIGSRAWLENIAWRAVSGLRNVEIDMRLQGSVAAPRLGVRSNVGDALAQSLRQVVGEEVRRIEQQVRSEVERRVADQVARAQAAFRNLNERAAATVGVPLADAERLEAELVAELRRFRIG